MYATTTLKCECLFSIECSFFHVKIRRFVAVRFSGIVVCICVCLCNSLWKFRKLENSNHCAVLGYCCCSCCFLFISAQKSNAHICNPTYWLSSAAAAAFIPLYKMICYARYFNIPTMFKCFQNLSARHPKKSNDMHTRAHQHIPELAKDSALIIYLFSFQVKWAPIVAHSFPSTICIDLEQDVVWMVCVIVAHILRKYRIFLSSFLNFSSCNYFIETCIYFVRSCNLPVSSSFSLSRSRLESEHRTSDEITHSRTKKKWFLFHFSVNSNPLRKRSAMDLQEWYTCR